MLNLPSRLRLYCVADNVWLCFPPRMELSSIENDMATLLTYVLIIISHF